MKNKIRTLPMFTALAAVMALSSCTSEPYVGNVTVASASRDSSQYGPGHAAAPYSPKGYGGAPKKEIYAPRDSNYVPGSGRIRRTQTDNDHAYGTVIPGMLPGMVPAYGPYGVGYGYPGYGYGYGPYGRVW